MDNLISRAAAIEYLMTNMGWKDEDGYTVDDADEKRAIITDLVNGIPAVDAVPIVRCKDCKHWHEDIGSTTKWLMCHVIVTDRNWFCADGERRESDGEA